MLSTLTLYTVPVFIWSLALVLSLLAAELTRPSTVSERHVKIE